jgi:aspartyl-tRNA(Asn)/glutamyl-tRNA(Gln) amidotransferase subunit A
MDLLTSDLKTIKSYLDNGEITAKQLVSFYLERIKKYDNKIKAFLSLNENALKEAEEIDSKRQKGEPLPPMAGIPIGLKDNIITKEIKTTCSSRILEHFVPVYDATVTKLLKNEGFIILGKLNMDEFAMGSSCESSYFQETRNPWDTNRVPGGSSGGSAAAVSARLVPAAIGSDTGGSIRQPASFCGITGMKPTYGRISRYGLVAFASSLDQIGPMTISANDSETLMQIIAKHDKNDSTSASVENFEPSKAATGNLNGIKIGVPEEFFAKGIEPDVEKAVKNAIAVFESLGAEILSIKMPHTDYAVAVYYIIATAEASSNLARYDGVRYGYRAEGDTLKKMYTATRSEGFGDEVKRRIMLGTYVLSAGYYDAYYLKAQKVRTLIKEDFLNAFKEVDAIIAPTSPTTAFNAGEKSNDPLSMYLSDIYTLSLNLFGGCGISIPCGFDSKHLPVGLQILGNYFQEQKVLNIAKNYQNSTDFHTKIPGWLE